ncbi:hypothetical protein Mp_4g16540 [Marchantia polymorpha subsp. ruderalis]|uniref:Uncharacterized protein n=2 Tax=Marchantia polymorpha TaxID=3197 RepID=A0AAF6BAJ5_MARPO|nr:hypothetical protein MARPO_0202s0002 [Marchantia polymorpha]BBN09029.1 hypothetical protein Mp_4g16540 [Marchantia polymorpha subsp. ruderalis]|eukprot:PTQ27373.1 hypothetical protein MARPO_0202s0002 [Marchantia polymorpha]
MDGGNSKRYMMIRLIRPVPFSIWAAGPVTGNHVGEGGWGWGRGNAVPESFDQFSPGGSTRRDTKAPLRKRSNDADASRPTLLERAGGHSQGQEAPGGPRGAGAGAGLSSAALRFEGRWRAQAEERAGSGARVGQQLRARARDPAALAPVRLSGPVVPHRRPAAAAAGGIGQEGQFVGGSSPAARPDLRQALRSPGRRGQIAPRSPGGFAQARWRQQAPLAAGVVVGAIARAIAEPEPWRWRWRWLQFGQDHGQIRSVPGRRVGEEPPRARGRGAIVADGEGVWRIRRFLEVRAREGFRGRLGLDGIEHEKPPPRDCAQSQDCR